LILAILIWVSMLITGIEKAKDSICKEKCGYLIALPANFQPIDMMFVKASEVFPVDYVLMILLVLFFFASSVSGLAAIGIRFLWITLFQIRKGRTSPQALLIATVMLSLMVLAVNYSMTTIVAPQYSVYGPQTFCDRPAQYIGGKPDCSKNPEQVYPCGSLFNREANSTCTPTVVSTFINRITVNYPFYGALDFWAQFAFLGVFLIVFVTALFRAPKFDMNEFDEVAENEEEEGLLASTGRKFGATWQDITGRAKGKSTSVGVGQSSQRDREYDD
jgi:LMBR1 domain-containing protein 1